MRAFDPHRRKKIETPKEFKGKMITSKKTFEDNVFFACVKRIRKTEQQYYKTTNRGYFSNVSLVFFLLDLILHCRIKATAHVLFAS